MYAQSGSFGNLDQNVTRLIEETVNSVEDMERRLTGLKIGIAQTFPQIAPILQAREIQHREQNALILSRLLATGQVPYGHVNHGVSTLPFGGASPMLAQGYLPGNLGVNQGMIGVSPNLFTGTNFPSGLQGGVSSLGNPFRLW